LYGRGASAIAREVSKAGVDISVEEAKEFIAKFMQQFPKVAIMIERTHEEVEHRGWVETLWGRRAFYPSMEGLANYKQLLAGQKRKGFNFLIQGYVGDLLRSALINFFMFRKANPHIGLDIILTVHDSIMAEVDIEHVEYVTNEVFPLCMSKQALCPRLPFEIGIDIDVSDRWDESLYYEDFLDRGFSDTFAEEYCKKDDEDNIIHRPDAA
jgi:DNA polymerase I